MPLPCWAHTAPPDLLLQPTANSYAALRSQLGCHLFWEALPDSASGQTRITCSVIAWFFLLSSLSLELYKGGLALSCFSMYPQGLALSRGSINICWMMRWAPSSSSGSFQHFVGSHTKELVRRTPSKQLIQMGKLRHRGGSLWISPLDSNLSFF